MTDDPLILGVDFTSAPRPRKPITVAIGRVSAAGLSIERIETLPSFDDFEQMLARPGPWVGGFDFPFGLPRILLQTLGWPCQPQGAETAWARMVRHLETLPRVEMVAAFRSWCDARPVGDKFAHRATDRIAGSSPSMKWVNPPVSFMLQAGAPRLLAAGVSLPGLHAGDSRRVALEAYPGWLARQVLGRISYKSDLPARNTPERLQARTQLVEAMEAGHLLGLPIWLPSAVRAACLADAQGDLLDAALCALQAAWAAQRAAQGYGLPPEIDPVEGWIVGC